MSTKMKNTTAKSLGFALLLSMFSVIAMGQEQQTNSETGINAKFGFKAGINFSNLYNIEVDDNNVRVGFNIGVFSKIPISKGVSLQPELLYTCLLYTSDAADER